ncbi:MAG: threonine--tRNA ligase [Eubacteriales bacterium]|nr:threonine--tRNA ligase [Eubacteriales bacterium]MDD4389440.1 threonine--tRNA ligase [Eubacteriales bacterium]
MKVILQDGSSIKKSFEDEIGREALRHTASHILAQAVKRLYPETKLAIGPAIKDGFYYDFDRETAFSESELEDIEKEMQKIIDEDIPLERSILSRTEAIALMEKIGEPYKIELINDLPDEAELSFFKQGDFIDLCAGPHAASTGEIKAFKLMSLAGAYWRGSEKNKMLARIYGTAFDKKKDLDEYLNRLEEAKKRDHRKLGRELGLFMVAEEGPGFPFFLPNGMVLKNTLIDYWRKLHNRWGYVEISTPLILNRRLWEQSGHWDHYKENIYMTTIDEQEYAVKPMNCPGGILVYNSEPRSYRDLPMRVGELGIVHRHELSGALHGLMRVRCFTQDDAHIYMTEEQIKDEIVGVARLFDEIYSLFGLPYRVELSTRPESSMGTEEEWEVATAGLRDALESMGIDYVVNEGDGAFYGPKLDFHLMDSIGRTWQCGTIQLDMQMPQRFDMTYVGADGQKHRPIMIHRTALGSIERFIGILIEHYMGKFPVWLSPVQARILPITEKHLEYANEICDMMKKKGIRCEVDSRQEKTGFKIRAAQEAKIPYMLVVGDKEVSDGSVSVRARETGKTNVMSKDDFLAKIEGEIDSKEQFTK